jgi:hypothetical protein
MNNPKYNPNSSNPVRTLPVKFVRGYFPLDGGAKLPAGTEAELPIDEAKSLIAEGIAVRNDKLPD